MKFVFMMDRYVAVYFSVLLMRYRAGITTDEMMAVPKSPFIAIGILEAVSIVGGMYAGGNGMVLLYISVKKLFALDYACYAL